MAKDYFMQIVDDLLRDMVEESIQKGMSEQEIIKKVEDINFEKILSDLIDEGSKCTLQDLRSKIFEISAERKASAASFIAHQECVWGKCFAASDAMYILAIEAGNDYIRYVEENVSIENRKERQYTYLCLQHIHGRICQEFLEILYLMKLGFADCAYARWRSMYELCCIGEFICKYGEQIAKQYYNQSETEEQFYNWTRGAKGKDGKEIKVNTFGKLQEVCDIPKEWKKQYRLACFVNHGSPQGTFKRLANGKTLNQIPVGHSDYGITTPAEHSAICLSWSTRLYLNIFLHPEGLVQCKVLDTWIDIIRDLYGETKKEAFKETEEEPSCPTST